MRDCRGRPRRPARAERSTAARGAAADHWRQWRRVVAIVVAVVALAGAGSAAAASVAAPAGPLPVALPRFPALTPGRGLGLLALVAGALLVLVGVPLCRRRPGWGAAMIVLAPTVLAVGGYLAYAGAVALPGERPPASAPVPADAASVANGQALFAKNCVVCHGRQGRGDGPNARGFNPPPTNFTHPAVAERSDDDLFAAITNGVPGTGMPAWAGTLNERERRDLVHYLRALNPLTADRVPAPPAVAAASPTARPTPPAPTPAPAPSPTAGVAPSVAASPAVGGATPAATAAASPTPPTPAASAPAIVSPPAAPAPTAPAGPTPTSPPFDAARVKLTLEPVASGFEVPLFVTHAGDGSNRLFVLEKDGRVRTLDGATVLDIRDRVNSPDLFSYEREQGLLGLAFHPRFKENGHFFVHYNGRDGNHVISRFTMGPDGRADPGGERVLLTHRQPGPNFNGGQLAFGPDGFLYIGFGTGGTQEQLQLNAQDPGDLLGKILRIDVDRGDPYAIPPGNPFVGQPGARPEVWAYGLRNPWRFSFDRATGDLYIASPGEFKREWINFHPAGGPAGQNFGWPVLEGNICWRQPTCDPSGLPRPIVEYNTYEGGNCAVIGGYVYRGQRSPRLVGAYLFGDFCGARIWAAARDARGNWVQSGELYKLDGLISSFGEDEAGELYVTDIQGGNVYRLVGSPR